MTVNPENFRRLASKRYAARVWIPLHLSRSIRSGTRSAIGYSESYEGVHSLVVPLGGRELGERYSWSDNHEHIPWASENSYKPADSHWRNDEDETGFRLVLQQNFPDRPTYYHLSHDFVISLGLAVEGDNWVRPSENYVEVARLTRDENGAVCGLEVKSEFLAEYLCARKAALRIASFRDQAAIIEREELQDDFDTEMEDFKGGRLEFRSMELDASGDLAGSGVAVFRMSRTDIDPDDDVPHMGPETPDNTEGTSWSFNRGEAVKVRVMADFWRDEWFEPSQSSLRIRHDDVPSEVTFITGANGSRTSADDLNDEDVGSWLWFKPEVVASLIGRRGAELNWYTRETGGISTPSDPSVHFGINEIGLVTVYARDVARLPEWERRFWAGHNVSPEGKVSAELLKAQVEALPSNTQAPEQFLPIIMEQFRVAWRNKYGSEIMRSHDNFEEIIAKCHRFRALDETGLFSLAKDLARVTADMINVEVARSVSDAEQVKKLGSLKSLESAIATNCNETIAHKICGPLFATYDLRLQDAHPPKTDISKNFEILQIDEASSTIFAGQSMIHMIVCSFDAMRRILEGQAENL